MDCKQLKTEDRNGKPWELVALPCNRCGGSGYISCYGHVDRGVCFKCNGDGSIAKWRRILSDKEKLYRERAKKNKLEKKLKKNLEKNLEIEKLTIEFMKKNTYIVNLENTYDIKEELKSLGAKFNWMLNWHFEEKVECDYPLIEIPNVLLYDGIGRLNKGAGDKVDEIKLEVNGSSLTGEHIGVVGDKIDMEIELFRSFDFESMYGGGTCYIFKDCMDNELCWYTSSSKKVPDGRFLAFFKVKSHGDYNGVKQTLIKNVKF